MVFFDQISTPIKMTTEMIIFFSDNDQVFKTIELQPCPNEPCIYRYLNDEGACFVLLYVDDALITGDPKTVQHIQNELTQHFKCKFNSPLDFLCLETFQHHF